MEPPHHFICPITHEVMVDPVVCAFGHSYERAAIECWLATHNITPVTNTDLPTKVLTPNHALRNMIQEWEQGTTSGGVHRCSVKSKFASVCLIASICLVMFWLDYALILNRVHMQSEKRLLKHGASVGGMGWFRDQCCSFPQFCMPTVRTEQKVWNISMVRLVVQYQPWERSQLLYGLEKRVRGSRAYTVYGELSFRLRETKESNHLFGWSRLSECKCRL